METAVRLAFVFFLVVLFPIWDLYETRRLKRSTNPEDKVRLYQLTVLWLWLGAIVALFATGFSPRQLLAAPPPEALPEFFGENPDVLWGVTGIFLIASGAPVVLSRFHAGTRAFVLHQMEPLRWFLPTTPRQRKWFAAVSVSAGTCEEVIYRSFLLRTFQDEPFGWALVVAVVVSCVIFGIGHLYQGPVGIFATGVLGAVFFLLFFLSGSLWIPMLVHALFDLRILLAPLGESEP